MQTCDKGAHTKTDSTFMWLDSPKDTPWDGQTTTINYPASENPNQVRYSSGGGQDDTEGGDIIRRAEMERGEAEAIQENGNPEGGSTATIEGGEAEAVQENGDPKGAVRRQ